MPALEERHGAQGVGQRQVAFGVAVNFDDLQRLAVFGVSHRAVDTRQRPGLHASFPALALCISLDLFMEERGRERQAGVGHFLFLRFTHRPPDAEPGSFEYPPV